MRRARLVLAAVVALLICSNAARAKSRKAELPLGLVQFEAPKNNRATPAKVALGKLLFFDTRLSRDNTVNCSTCHNPKLGWTDQSPTVIGVRNQIGERSAPTLLNSAYQTVFFWDGRAASLEEQALEPIANPREMDLTHAEVVARVAAIPGYAPYFKRAFGSKKVTIDRIAKALASFERTIVSGNSPYDRYAAGDQAALSTEAVRGLHLFQGRAKCVSCHGGPNLTDEEFHNLGVGLQRKETDLGRFRVTQKDADRGAFKTPTLRNLGDTFPYMHDGSLATLRDVIDLIDAGGRPNQWLSPEIKPLGLSAQEKDDLLAFLEALNGDKAIVDAPENLPK